MELIFFYVNQSRTKFIEKQGFNFSSRYKFSVEYDKGTYILKGFECENPLPQNFFDETGCITNVTAVVGENGSGKTTLLTKLLGYSGQVKDKDHAPEYDAFFAEEYEIDKAISIYWDGNDLVCYHNIDEFENDTELLKENRVFYLTQGSDLLANMIANDKGFFDISKICVSNSIYGSNSEFVSMGNLEQLSLNMNSMQGLGNRFFRRKIRTNNRIVGEYFEVQDIMANEKEMADFQRILDILYLDYIHSNKSGSLFAENVGKYLSVKFHTSGKILNDYYSKNMNDKNADKEWLNYYDCVNENIFKEFDYESVKNDICFHLYTNLLYELMVCLMLENENHVKNKKELTKLIEKLLEQVKRNGSSAYEVLASAYAEIQEYEKVLEKVEVVGNTLPPSDFGYEICGQLKYKDKNKEEESDADEIDTYQIKYSELSPEQKKLYHMQIKSFLKKLVYEYNNFEEWFSQLFISDILLKNDREIIICECDYQLAGIAILKNDNVEKKICTLRVAKRFQRQGIGQHLMELSFEWLNDDKPLITIHNSKKHEFNKLFKRYNFELEEKKWGYYRLFRTELVYNGSLPEKNFFLNSMEIIDLEKEIGQFLLSGRNDFKLFINEWLYHQWLYSQKEIKIITGY